MNIYLTLDYELFMGSESGSVQNCLIRPMKRLVERTQDLGVHFTLFVDAAYLYKLSEFKSQNPELQEDYDQIANNLRDLAAKGHSIQLHIHPQWYYSTYEGGQWRVDQSHYRLSDISASDLQALFNTSKKLLESIIGKNVIAYRAGGYSLQSLEGYAKFLYENGINVDSSVASGQKYMSEYQWYDYSHIKGGKVYRFSNDISKEDKNGRLLEYPISCIHISTISYIIYRLYLKYFKHIGRPFGDGRAVPGKQDVHFFKTRVMNYSFDYVMAPMLYSAFKKLKNKDHKDIVIIGHPKNQSTESVEELRSFIKKTNREAKFCVI